MVLEPTLLLGSQDRNLLFGVVEREFEVNVGLFGLVRLNGFRRQVVLVFQLGDSHLAPQLPGQERIARNVGHVVSIHEPPGYHAVADDREKGHKYVIDDINNVELFLADVDPSDEEQNPGKAEQGDKGGV